MGLEKSIEETLTSIKKTKKTNQQIRQRNKTLGDSIHNNDEFLDNMHKLELQVELMLKRRDHLEKKLHQVQQANN